MTKVGKVLLIEDHENWQRLISRILHREGYEVDIASSYQEAVQRLQQTFYHLAIMDIRLVDWDEANSEGMTILDEMKRLGLSEAIEKIMLSAYGTWEQLRTAFKHHDVADFVSKDMFDPEEFLQIVREVFDKRVQSNFGLHIVLQNRLTYEQVLSGVLVGGKRLRVTDTEFLRVVDEFDDLMRRLFYEADQIVLRPLSHIRLAPGVLRVEPFYAEGHGEQVIVKVGDYTQIDLEYRNYKSYVHGFVGGNRATHVLDLQRTALLGGIIYSLLGASSHEFEDFATFYSRHNPAEILQVVDNLFKATCANWYADRKRIQRYDLTQEYAGHLELSHDKLETALKDNFPYFLNRDLISFRDYPRKVLLNPIHATKGQSLSCSTYCCTTHGDLHAFNIFVDSHSYTWLVDFDSTGKGHILRDCIELEAEVKFWLLKPDNLGERCHFEEALMSMNRFSEVAQIAYNPSGEEFAKAFAVICKLREIAGDLVSPNDDFSEYLMGLLYYSLNTLRFYSLPKVNRLHALYTAAMICEKLGLSASSDQSDE